MGEGERKEEAPKRSWDIPIAIEREKLKTNSEIKNTFFSIGVKLTRTVETWPDQKKKLRL